MHLTAGGNGLTPAPASKPSRLRRRPHALIPDQRGRARTFGARGTAGLPSLGLEPLAWLDPFLPPPWVADERRIWGEIAIERSQSRNTCDSLGEIQFLHDARIPEADRQRTPRRGVGNPPDRRCRRVGGHRTPDRGDHRQARPAGRHGRTPSPAIPVRHDTASRSRQQCASPGLIPRSADASEPIRAERPCQPIGQSYASPYWMTG
jgi:hypothetical protein